MSRVTVSSCPSESQQAYPFLGFRENQYAVKVGDLQRVQIPPGQSVARPEAIRIRARLKQPISFSVPSPAKAFSSLSKSKECRLNRDVHALALPKYFWFWRSLLA
jgi:hypothetical protein